MSALAHSLYLKTVYVLSSAQKPTEMGSCLRRSALLKNSIYFSVQNSSGVPQMFFLSASAQIYVSLIFCPKNDQGYLISAVSVSQKNSCPTDVCPPCLSLDQYLFPQYSKMTELGRCYSWSMFWAVCLYSIQSSVPRKYERARWMSALPGFGLKAFRAAMDRRLVTSARNKYVASSVQKPNKECPCLGRLHVLKY